MFHTISNLVEFYIDAASKQWISALQYRYSFDKGIFMLSIGCFLFGMVVWKYCLSLPVNLFQYNNTFCNVRFHMFIPFIHSFKNSSKGWSVYVQKYGIQFWELLDCWKMCLRENVVKHCLPWFLKLNVHERHCKLIRAGSWCNSARA